MRKFRCLDYSILQDFTCCSDAAIHAFFDYGSISSFSRGMTIYSKDNLTCQSLYFLLTGMVKISTANENGKTMIKDIVYPGSFFSEEIFFCQPNNNEMATSLLNETEVLRIKTQDFNKLCQEYPEMLLVLLEEISKKVLRKEEKLASFHFNNARSRIIIFLTEAAEKNGTKIGYEILIKNTFTQQDIADITGTSRQTVTSVLNNMKKRNIIYYDRKRILIRDLDLLK